jgi:hypothetical protein
MLLNERQQKAQALSHEMAKMHGVWITSPLPLDDSAKLRFQLLDTERDRVLELLRSWEWQPAFCGLLPRVTFTGMQGACVYEIDFPRETPVPDDRTIQVGLTDREKAEVAGMRKYLGFK